ncbi:alpha-keto acid decarboxylase family protein [Paenibacillus sp. HJL G12]|uniref:Alpha-keto-acid decarboxylase n=1 Tax=Paenibacillus dendrobii TaxID=2691084 RepID=A0A7X3IGA5_9BACL|nr:thiamine pyrophosphate-binding protein [Paenibacillus dendrobii]MWV42896.1 alpha-keto acid decarboxylase family protein [Paenibacillus dendrobii]
MNTNKANPTGAALSKTLGEYLYDRLKEEGITDIFGVPGDYNFTLLDTLERCAGIRFVNGRNELNSGYAADAYARLNGISALITTFGVGEMSACNAIAGANSEHVPIIHIVGSPPDKDQKERKLMHHTLMNGDYDVFRKVYEPITAYTAVLTPENAAIEIPNAIQIAKQQKKPVYLVVADDLVTKPIMAHHVTAIPQEMTNPTTMKAAVEHIKHMLNQSKNTVILADVKTMRFHLQEYVRKLAESMNVPVASTLFGKGAFDESHPLFLGMYGGAFGSPEVRTAVENADCVITVGLVWADTNTANFTAQLNPLRTVDIQPDRVKVGAAEYPSVMAADILLALQKVGYKEDSAANPSPAPYDPMVGNPDDPLSAASYYPRFQRMLKEGDVVVVETGTFFYGMSQVKLPRGVTYIAEGGWQSIGYATPSAYGACIAAPTRRVLLFTGDGSLQLTAQEISSMLYYGCKPIIFVLNNDGYTIEKYLNVKTENQTYNKIPKWSYTKLAEAFGGDAYTVTVRTNRELDDAISRAEQECSRELCIIEMIVSDPMDGPDYMHKMRDYMEKQEKQRS